MQPHWHPDRRAQAQRYMVSSGAKLRFWLSALVYMPAVNAGLFATWAFGHSTSQRGDSSAWPLAVVPLVLGLEALVLRRFVARFATRGAASRTVVGGLVLVCVVTLLMWAAILIAYWLMHASD